MEIKWLEDFVTLAQTSSFSRAAEMRHVTQPAFSRRIKQLETWMGVPLISRASMPPELTLAGRRFLPIAQDTIRTFHSARESLRPDPEADFLRFAALHTLTVTFFPKWLQCLSKTQGWRTAFTPDRGGIEANLAALVDNEADLFLTYAQSLVPIELDKQRFASIKVGSDRLIPVCAPQLSVNGTLSEGPALFQAALQGKACLPYLSYGETSFFGMALRRMFALRPAFQRMVLHENTISAGLLSMARTGAGLCWLPESLAAEDIAAGRLMAATEDPLWALDLEIRLYRHLESSSPKIEALWQAAQDLSRP